jgi:hypothetical protein
LLKLDVRKVELEEAEYIDQVIQEAMIVHADKNSLKSEWIQKRYPFQINEDLIYEDSVILTDESELSETSDDDVELKIEGTTDSSFKAACYNVKLMAINESSFSLEAFADLQQKDAFCSEKIELLRKKNSKASRGRIFS